MAAAAAGKPDKNYWIDPQVKIRINQLGDMAKAAGVDGSLKAKVRRLNYTEATALCAALTAINTKHGNAETYSYFTNITINNVGDMLTRDHAPEVLTSKEVRMLKLNDVIDAFEVHIGDFALSEGGKNISQAIASGAYNPQERIEEAQRQLDAAKAAIIPKPKKGKLTEEEHRANSALQGQINTLQKAIDETNYASELKKFSDASERLEDDRSVKEALSHARGFLLTGKETSQTIKTALNGLKAKTSKANYNWLHTAVDEITKNISAWEADPISKTGKAAKAQALKQMQVALDTADASKQATKQKRDNAKKAIDAYDKKIGRGGRYGSLNHELRDVIEGRGAHAYIHRLPAGPVPEANLPAVLRPALPSYDVARGAPPAYDAPPAYMAAAGSAHAVYAASAPASASASSWASSSVYGIVPPALPPRPRRNEEGKGE